MTTCDCVALLMAEADRYYAQADTQYARKQPGYARRSRVRAAACGWAAGVLKKAGPAAVEDDLFSEAGP